MKECSYCKTTQGQIFEYMVYEVGDPETGEDWGYLSAMLCDSCRMEHHPKANLVEH